jgi:hypothetical protein
MISVWLNSLAVADALSDGFLTFRLTVGRKVALSGLALPLFLGPTQFDLFEDYLEAEFFPDSPPLVEVLHFVQGSSQLKPVAVFGVSNQELTEAQGEFKSPSAISDPEVDFLGITDLYLTDPRDAISAPRRASASKSLRDCCDS